MKSLMIQQHDSAPTINLRKPKPLYFSILTWSIGLIIKACYRLGLFALSRGGTVEFQIGPIKYKAIGRADDPIDKNSDFPSGL